MWKYVSFSPQENVRDPNNRINSVFFIVIKIYQKPLKNSLSKLFEQRYRIFFLHTLNNYLNHCENLAKLKEAKFESPNHC